AGGAGDAGQGAGGTGAAGDRLPRLPAFHLELEAPRTGPALPGRAGGAARLRGGGGALASRHAGPLRDPLLERALRRQPLAPDGAGPARRPRLVRVLPARARLWPVPVDRARSLG